MTGLLAHPDQVAADAQILTEYVQDGVTRVEHPA